MSKILINSLPKSGTNLLAKCLEMLGYKEVSHLGSGLYLKNPLRRLAGFTFRQGYLLGIDTPVEVSRILVNKELELKKKQFVTAHVGYTADILDYILTKDIRPILITRDPRAVISSFVHYVSSEKKHPLHDVFFRLSEIEKFKSALNGICIDGYQLQPLRLRCDALEPWLRCDRVLKIKFEDIVGEKGGGSDDVQTRTLEKIISFIGEDSEKIDLVKQGLFGPGRVTFRKGQIDLWKQEIPGEIISMIMEQCQDVLERWGYSCGSS